MNMRRVPLFTWSALVGARRTAIRARADRRTDLHLRRLPLRPRRRSAAIKGINEWIGFGFTQPATFVYAVPAASGSPLEVIAVAQRPPAADARRRSFTGFGLVGIARARGAVTQQPATIVTWCRQHHVRDCASATSCRTRCFNLLPIARRLSSSSSRRCAMRRAPAAARRGSPRRWCSACSAALMVFVGVARQRACTTSATRTSPARCSRRASPAVHRLRRVLTALGAITYWGPKLWGRAMPDKAVAAARPARASSPPCSPRCRARSPGSPSSRPTPSAPSSTTAVRRSCGTGSSAAGHVLMSSRSSRLRRCWRSRSFTQADALPATIRGTARRWSGRPRRRRPYANFADVHIVTSPEPLLDLKRPPSHGETADARPAARSGARATPPAVRRHRARLRRRRAVIGGMLAMWMRFREPTRCRVVHRAAAWIPKKHQHPEGARQHHAARVRPRSACSPSGRCRPPRRDDRRQRRPGARPDRRDRRSPIDQRPGVHLRPDEAADRRPTAPTNAMFYAITGTFIVLLHHRRSAFSVVTAFRYLGGRTDRSRDRLGPCPVSGTSSRWSSSALWFVVYVTK